MLAVLLIGYGLKAQDNSFCIKQKAVLSKIDREHYLPRERDTVWMDAVLELTLQELDQEKTLFSQSDYEILESKISAWWTAVESGECPSLQEITSIYKNALDRKSATIRAMKASDLDFTIEENLPVNLPEKRMQFTVEELQRYRHKKMKLAMLFDYAGDSDNEEKNGLNNPKTKRRIFKKIKDQELCDLNKLKQDEVSLKTKVENAYLNALLQSQDRHSAFFTVEEKTDFEESVATDQRSFGIYFSRRNQLGDAFVVSYIVTTGLEKSEPLPQENDELVDITVDGKKVDLTCMDGGDLNAVISASKRDKIKLTLKKPDGEQYKTIISKRELPVISSFLRGYQIDGEYGYLRINSFYTDLDVPGGLGVANDAAAEIYKLQKQQLAGLIVDLRGNGGGSLKEAVDLAGLFINRGPVAIVDERETGKPMTAMDLNRGTAFAGPLIVLIDNYSASASELFAATMQDYNRGILVGDTTYGKSTMQSITPLTAGDELSFVKMTVGAFYNVKGRTHYGNGIQPDIQLPAMDMGALEDMHEQIDLQLPKLDPAPRFRPAAPLPTEELGDLSKKRVLASGELQNIAMANQHILQLAESPIVLTVDGINDFMDRYNRIFNQDDESIEPQLQVTDHPSTTEILAYNSADAEYNDYIKEEIATDPYIIESIQILKDLIRLK